MSGCAAAAVPSGTEAYAKLYPEKSTDGVLRLGNVVGVPRMEGCCIFWLQGSRSS